MMGQQQDSMMGQPPQQQMMMGQPPQGGIMGTPMMEQQQQPMMTPMMDQKPKKGKISPNDSYGSSCSDEGDMKKDQPEEGVATGYPVLWNISLYLSILLNLNLGSKWALRWIDGQCKHLAVLPPTSHSVEVEMTTYSSRVRRLSASSLTRTISSSIKLTPSSVFKTKVSFLPQTN